MGVKLSITENDFTTVSNAAIAADIQGEDDDAQALDQLARRMNLALSNEAVRGPWLPDPRKRSWRDMPSTLDPLSGRTDEQ